MSFSVLSSLSVCADILSSDKVSQRLIISLKGSPRLIIRFLLNLYICTLSGVFLIIVQFIFYFWSFEISRNILRIQKIL